MNPTHAIAAQAAPLHTAERLARDAAFYQAMKAHDARFDGRFYVGVTSTKIYCRPICRVRLPLRKNCTFHPSAAAAEVAGFRPCLKCRPELAPGLAAIASPAGLARAAAVLLEDARNAGLTLPALAQRVGVTGRHLRRIFAAEFGVAPIQYAQTQRMLLAKRLLTDTTLAVTEVAFAAGFSSVRRMNALFASRYGFAPTRLRHAAKTSAALPADSSAGIGLLVSYRAPFDWAGLLDFFAARAIPGVERIAQGRYQRVLRLPGAGASAAGAKATLGWLDIGDCTEKSALDVKLSGNLVPHLSTVLALVRRVFDLHMEPAEVYAALGAATPGFTLSLHNPGLRLPGAFDAFELAMRAILGQQITVQAARTLATRVVRRLQTPPLLASAESRLGVTSKPKEPNNGEMANFPNTAFPSAAQIGALGTIELCALGIVSARAQAMIDMAQFFNSDAFDAASRLGAPALITALCQIKGIGPWTANYIAMRALSWPDAWPPRDVVVQNALHLANNPAGQRQADTISQHWRPWRSYAVLHLWAMAARGARPTLHKEQ
jgi:AraC family transcriptional regulator, regulatory protein of adaptative response / DNA-3-methyladenine glycosylase II